LAKGDSEQTWYLTFQDTPNGSLRMINVTDQPQTIYKNTFAAMAETIPDRNIINKFPLSTQHPLVMF
jgi:ABC-type xylose transport system substrate-binding protein